MPQKIQEDGVRGEHAELSMFNIWTKSFSRPHLKFSALYEWNASMSIKAMEKHCWELLQLWIINSQNYKKLQGNEI